MSTMDVGLIAAGFAALVAVCWGVFWLMRNHLPYEKSADEKWDDWWSDIR